MCTIGPKLCYAQTTSDKVLETMRLISSIVALLVLTACQQEAVLPDTGLAGYDPHAVETRRADCEKRGGRFGTGGLSGGLVCFETPRDANKSCSKSTDCEGECLSRSRTCSPIKPLYGCQDVLTSTGKTTKLCLE